MYNYMCVCLCVCMHVCEHFHESLSFKCTDKYNNPKSQSATASSVVLAEFTWHCIMGCFLTSMQSSKKSIKDHWHNSSSCSSLPCQCVRFSRSTFAHDKQRYIKSCQEVVKQLTNRTPKHIWICAILPMKCLKAVTIKQICMLEWLKLKMPN